MALSYANLYMGQLKYKMLKDALDGLTPIEWIRFIHEIFAIWTHGIDKLNELLKHINNFHLLNLSTHRQPNLLAQYRE